MIKVLIISSLVLSNKFDENTLKNYIPKSLQENTVCNEVICGVVDDATHLSTLAVGLLRAKIKTNPVITRDYHSKHNVNEPEVVSKLFSEATIRGQDYAHLIEPFNAATEVEHIGMLNADYNRVYMEPLFNRSGLWKKSEKLIESHLRSQPTLIDISGVDPNIGFFKIILNPVQNAVISFSFPNGAEDGKLSDYITSIKCINNKYNLNLLEQYEDISKFKAWSTAIWVMNGGVDDEVCQ